MLDVPVDGSYHGCEPLPVEWLQCMPDVTNDVVREMRRRDKEVRVHAFDYLLLVN
jgi:hypothetical protein